MGRRRHRAGARSLRPALLGAIAVGALAGAPAAAEVSAYDDRYESADPNASQQLGQGVEQAFTDLDAMLFPPWELEEFQALDTNASCETIYRELNQRVPQTETYLPKFSDNPWNSLIGALGTMWWPAWLLWIVPEVARYRENRQIKHNRERVRYLRELSAEKQCWVKW